LAWARGLSFITFVRDTSCFKPVGLRMITFAWIAVVVSGLIIFFAVAQAASDVRAEEGDAPGATQTEMIAGKRYSVVTRTLLVVREKRTGRVGILMARGWQNDPVLINGKIELVPHWINIQFVRKSDGKAGRTEWRRYENFENIGKTEVHFLTHRVGFFSTESLIRYPANLGKLLGRVATR
jgi:hypothetical protein